MRNKNLTRGVAIAAIALFVVFLIFQSLPKQKPDPVIKKKERIQAPSFSSEFAYDFIQSQVDFGPRNPNSDGAKACGDWLIEKLESFGGNVITQEDIVTAFDGTKLEMRNIIAEFQPEKRKRIMLFAHWDTRPFADKDTVRINEPILGANDGGSGVGVLLEIARVISEFPTEYGIDIVLFDSEDYGSPANYKGQPKAGEWCLGSQYWSRNPHRPNYKAKYGILLDMVGGKSAKFPREGTSLRYAESIVNKIWESANRLGHSSLFRTVESGLTTDDHLYVNRDRGIHSAAIVEFHVNQMGYGKFHHTHQDNMDVISKTTLQAVGDVVMDVIYNE